MNNIFIGIGSTASDGIIQLIKSLKQSGIYLENDAEFKDSFIAIDTDPTALKRFTSQGSTRHVQGIQIKPTDKNEKTPASHWKDVIAPLNSAWKENEIQIPSDGVFGIRSRSYSDLSWCNQLKTYLRPAKPRPEQKEFTPDYRVIVVATTYGGTSSGLFYNVANFIRANIDPRIPSYCLLLLPSDDFAKEQKYAGWKNFCNFWQEMKHQVWETLLSAHSFVFPYFAGYSDTGLIEKNLFKIKADIHTYRPSQTGCRIPFNNIFPLLPQKGESTRDSSFFPEAVAEMAIFLFYLNAMNFVPSGENIEHRNNAADVTIDDLDFIGLRLIAARCSPYTVYYNLAYRYLSDACNDIFKVQEEDQPKPFDITKAICTQELREPDTNERVSVDNQVNELLKDFAKVIDFINGIKSDVYYGRLKDNAEILPTFDVFLKENEWDQVESGKITFSALLNTYKDFYNQVKQEAENFDKRKEAIQQIYDRAQQLIDCLAVKSKLSTWFNVSKNLQGCIEKAALESLKDAWGKYYRSAMAKIRLEYLEEQQNNPPGNSLKPFQDPNNIVYKVDKWVKAGGESQDLVRKLTNEASAAFMNLLAAYKPLAQQRQTQKMFSRICNTDLSAQFAEYLRDRHGHQGEARELIFSFLRSAMRENQFDKSLADLVDDLKRWQSERTPRLNVTIPVKIEKEQVPFWPDHEAVARGQYQSLFYISKPLVDNGVTVDVKNLKLRTDLFQERNMKLFSQLRGIPDHLLTNWDENRGDDFILRTDGDRLTAVCENNNDNVIDLGSLEGEGVGKTFIKLPQETGNSMQFTHDRRSSDRLYGIWAGESALAMSAKQVLQGYIENLNTIIGDSLSVTELQDRLLITLQEDVFYGLFLGIIAEKLDLKAKEIYDKDYFVVTIRKPDDKGKVWTTGETGCKVADFGYNSKKSQLDAVPIDLLKALKNWFDRPIDSGKKQPSQFANDLAGKIDGKEDFVAVLERRIDNQELDLFGNNTMTYAINQQIFNDLRDLRNYCQGLVECQIIRHEY